MNNPSAIFDKAETGSLQISDTVYPMYKAYIEPDLETAHLRIYNTFNPFSGFMNATYILKSNKPITKQAIKECLKVNFALLNFGTWFIWIWLHH